MPIKYISTRGTRKKGREHFMCDNNTIIIIINVSVVVAISSNNIILQQQQSQERHNTEADCRDIRSPVSIRINESLFFFHCQ